MLQQAGRHLALTILSFIVFIACSERATFAARFIPTPEVAEPMSEAESYVLAQLKKGEKADFKDFPEDKRVIRASFLKRLLINSIEGLKLESSGVRIKNAVIDGELEISNEKIPSSVSLISCTFRNLVLFYHVIIAGDLNLSNTFEFLPTNDRPLAEGPGTVFENQLLFINVHIDGDIEASNSVFKWKPPETTDCQKASSICDAADFEEMKVANSAFFNNTVFEGPADFEGAHFEQVFFARQAKFKSIANFVTITVADDADFFESTFDSGADFSRAKIDKQFGLENVIFNDPGQGVSFQDMQIGQLTLNKNTQVEGKPRIGGITYQRIAMSSQENDEEAWDIWLRILNKTEYRVDAYATLEEFIKKQGHPKHADQVYISQRDRRAAEIYKKSFWRGVGAWLFDTFLKWAVGYGRRPWLAFIYSIVIVAVGCFVFPRSKMDLQKNDENPRDYNRFWYSIDLYLPVVELHSSSFWMPKREETTRWHYLHVHALLGWILVPIGLAALTGIIK